MHPGSQLPLVWDRKRLKETSPALKVGPTSHAGQSCLVVLLLDHRGILIMQAGEWFWHIQGKHRWCTRAACATELQEAPCVKMLLVKLKTLGT